MAIPCPIGDILAQRYCVSVGRPSDPVTMGEYTPRELVTFFYYYFCAANLLIALNSVNIAEREEHTFYARTIYLRMAKAITLGYMSENIW